MDHRTRAEAEWNHKQLYAHDVLCPIARLKTDYILSSADTLHPHHVVLATGASGKPSIPPIPGTDAFQGDRLIHSSQFQGVPPNASGKGKNAVVIGSSNSAHDIAQDYHEHGHNVTILQRSSTHVVGCQTLMDVTMAGLYCEGGVRTPQYRCLSRPSTSQCQQPIRLRADVSSATRR